MSPCLVDQDQVRRPRCVGDRTELAGKGGGKIADARASR